MKGKKQQDGCYWERWTCRLFFTHATDVIANVKNNEIIYEVYGHLAGIELGIRPKPVTLGIKPLRELYTRVYNQSTHQR